MGGKKLLEADHLRPPLGGDFGQDLSFLQVLFWVQTTIHLDPRDL
jgi:hypothetical protein